ncbi:hypothetical protein [Halobacterium jilantaiense]|uniref:DUF8060 domain-containing protein n=1 Tax=Halobacterium jilantaiense TaxID=355548 RepID=A0A1I0QJF7_9EURY|nr:hypothetical protein [Halobacterium jilantaiense]SEW27358.1 hypothetical protein SAMN04487945_2673 [Halobacterium jilantaiense]
MSDTDRTQSTTDDGDAPAASTAETDTDDGSDGSGRRTADSARDDRSDVRDLILRGALVVLGFVAVVALVQFYTSAVAVINEWVGREYRALFRAAFNLVVLLAAGIGISAVVRELTGGDAA